MYTQDSPAGVVFTYTNEHLQNENSDLRFVHERHPSGHCVPLELTDVAQLSPAVHTLSPALGLLIESTILVHVLHLKNVYTVQYKVRTYIRTYVCVLYTHVCTYACMYVCTYVHMNECKYALGLI